MFSRWLIATSALVSSLAPLRAEAAGEPAATGEVSERDAVDAVEPPIPAVPSQLKRSFGGRSAQLLRDPILGAALPRWYGTSLAAGAGLSGAVAWASTFAQIALTRCDAPAGPDGLQICGSSDVMLGSLAGLGHVGAWRAASVGARMVGHRDALAFVAGTDRKRHAAGYLGSGAALFALGLGSWLGTKMLVDTQSCTDATSCTQLRRTELATLQLGSSLISAGGGLLAYAIAYERADRRLRRGGLIGHIRITPELTATFAGVSIGGRY